MAASRRAACRHYQEVNQWDVSLGGPIIKDRVWFFGIVPVRRSAQWHQPDRSRISPAAGVPARLRTVRQRVESHQPYIKLTSAGNRTTQLSGVLAVRPEPIHERPRTRDAPINPQRRRWVAVSGQAELGLGNRLHDAVFGVLQQQGRRPTRTRTEISRASGPRSKCIRARSSASGRPTGTGVAGDDEQRADAEHPARRGCGYSEAT